MSECALSPESEAFNELETADSRTGGTSTEARVVPGSERTGEGHSELIDDIIKYPGVR